MYWATFSQTHLVIWSPPATQETGAMGREIEPPSGNKVVAFKEKNKVGISYECTLTYVTYPAWLSLNTCNGHLAARRMCPGGGQQSLFDIL
jgi:hypothetical protein